MDEVSIGDRIAQEVAQEMQGKPLPPLSEEEIAVRTAWREEIRARDQLEHMVEQWEAEQRREEQQRLEAEAEARRAQAQRQAQQREAAERMQREARERASLRAAETAAAQSQQTRDRLARLEAQENHRQRQAAQWATVQRLGQLLDPPPPPEPEVIVVEPEEPYDPSRRFKFDWQP